MAYSHPFIIALENYLLADFRHKIMIQVDLRRVLPIKNVGTDDFKINLELSNLVMEGQATQIISEDEEVVLHLKSAESGKIECSKLLQLDHKGKHVHLVYSRTVVQLKAR